jgi:hypothetical protein
MQLSGKLKDIKIYCFSGGAASQHKIKKYQHLQSYG